MLVSVIAFPFFVGRIVVPEEVHQLFFGLQLEVAGPYNDHFRESHYMVGLSQVMHKLQDPAYAAARQFFIDRVYPFAEQAGDGGSLSDLADAIQIPLRASACMSTNGTTH